MIIMIHNFPNKPAFKDDYTHGYTPLTICKLPSSINITTNCKRSENRCLKFGNINLVKLKVNLKIGNERVAQHQISIPS
jgi:hypothetical protein